MLFAVNLNKGMIDLYVHMYMCIYGTAQRLLRERLQIMIKQQVTRKGMLLFCNNNSENPLCIVFP